jgi:hypothetical protein
MEDHAGVGVTLWECIAHRDVIERAKMSGMLLEYDAGYEWVVRVMMNIRIRVCLGASSRDKLF